MSEIASLIQDEVRTGGITQIARPGVHTGELNRNNTRGLSKTEFDTVYKSLVDMLLDQKIRTFPDLLRLQHKEDETTSLHSHRVAGMAVLIAKTATFFQLGRRGDFHEVFPSDTDMELSNSNENTLTNLARGALIHDLAKIVESIKSAIHTHKLLTPQQKDLISAHPELAAKLAEAVKLSPVACESIEQHHQLIHPNQFGSFGYPIREKREKVSFGATATRIADISDAEATPWWEGRQYKKGSDQRCIEQILSENMTLNTDAFGSEFTPTLHETYVETNRRILNLLYLRKDFQTIKSSTMSGEELIKHQFEIYSQVIRRLIPFLALANNIPLDIDELIRSAGYSKVTSELVELAS